MSANNTDEGFVPASLDYIAPDSISQRSQPVRVSFEPFGRPDEVGDPDPGHPDYRIADARVLYRATKIVTDGRVVYLRGVGKQEYVLADGRFFRPDGGLPKWAKDDLDLSEYRTVFGRKAADGNGFVAIGIHPVVLQPE